MFVRVSVIYTIG